MSELITVTDDGPVRIVRMNRPDKKNALTMDMYEAMAAAIEDAPKNAALRCLMIAGAPTVFCAGNDIGDFLKAAGAGGALGAPILRFLHTLARNELPLVAAVQGNAIGVGTTMLLHCDHVVASSEARFSTPFVALGLVPEAASSLLAPRLLGHARAFELLVMGKPLNAAEAKAAGLINTVVAPDALEAAALAAARVIAALPPQAVQASRRLMHSTPDEIGKRIDDEAEEFKARLQSSEAQAAFMAFMSRKK
ncbi:MAG: crotonase/enoyl-CoA hydratase family protein [Pseudolabrys sp.]